jgi:excisionase family DNA binding protein
MTLMSQHVGLTTQEAADILNVSPAFLGRVLESGRVPYHELGAQLRVRFSDLMMFKRRRDVESEAALRELTGLSQELKLDEERNEHAIPMRRTPEDIGGESPGP